MREQDEIVARIEKVKESDIFGFESIEYIDYLDFEHAKPYLKEGVTQEEWDVKSQDAIRERMGDYMDFAWNKAINCRGISAGRSIAHYQAWLWIEGAWADEDIKALEDYEHYGKDELTKICKHLGLDASQWDDNYRVNNEDELEDAMQAD